jgi:hypothetical protein
VNEFNGWIGRVDGCIMDRWMDASWMDLMPRHSPMASIRRRMSVWAVEMFGLPHVRTILYPVDDWIGWIGLDECIGMMNDE